MSDPLRRDKLAEIGATCACFSLRRAARVVTQLYDEALRPAGIRITQFTLLAVVAASERITIGELATATDTDRTTLTRNLAVLTDAGLVTVGPGDDPRTRIVELTSAGRARLAKALPLWHKAQRVMTRRLGASRLVELRADLAAAVNAVSD